MTKTKKVNHIQPSTTHTRRLRQRTVLMEKDANTQRVPAIAVENNEQGPVDENARPTIAKKKRLDLPVVFLKMMIHFSFELLASSPSPYRNMPVIRLKKMTMIHLSFEVLAGSPSPHRNLPAILLKMMMMINLSFGHLASNPSPHRLLLLLRLDRR